MPTVLCPELIGRADALAVAGDALGGAARGEGRLLFVTGEAGVGKSRFAREIVELAKAQGMPVLFGRAVPAEVPVPYRPIVGALLSHFRGEHLPNSPELAPFRPALGRLLPEWHVEGRDGSDPTVVLAEGLVRLLKVIAGTTGCVLVLEDLHWADPETLALLEYFADALTSEHVLCLATVRAEEPSGARQLVHALGAARSASVVEIGALTDAELHQMASACLGADDLAEEAYAFLRSWADGLPFMVEELLAGAVAVGALSQDADGWVLDSSFGPLVPVSFADNVRGRLDGLGPDGKRVLQLAAVLGRRFEWTMLGDATGQTPEDVTAVLRAGVANQLLVAEAGNSFRFRHALTRGAVLDDLLPAERTTYAAALLDVVESKHPELPDEWCELAAGLAEQSGRTEQAAAYLLELGRRALNAEALSSAETLLDRARRSTTSVMLQTDIDEVLLDVLALAGRTQDAINAGSRLADRLRRMTAPTVRRAKADLGVARAAVTACRWDVASAHLDRARLEAADDAELSARIATLTAIAALGQGDPDSALAQAELALGSAERLGVHELACEALEVIGRCARLSDAVQSEAAFARALQIAQNHDLPLWQARAMAELGTLDQLNCADDSRLLRARELALACGAWAIAAHVDLTLGHWALNHFDADEALRHHGRCEELAASLGMGVLAASAVIGQGMGHAMRADVQAVEETFAAASQSPAAGDPGVMGMAWSARAMSALFVEDVPSALEYLAQADEQFAALPTAPPVPTRAMHALLVLQNSASDDVRTAADELRSVHVIARGYLAIADAVTLGRDGRAADAQAAFALAEQAMERADGWRHYAYRLAAVDALADGWGDPARWLREALAYFEAQELPRVADSCRALLRGAGVPVPRRTKAADGLPEQLRTAGVTAREAEVLALLGQGLSNQEIADQTFLSARTVERHLANIAAKVGTRSRAELVALAARNGAS